MQSGANLTHGEPTIKTCAVTLDYVCMSRTKVKSDHAKILLLEHMYSPYNPILLILYIRRAFQ